MAGFLQGLDEVPHQSEFAVSELGADGYPGGSMLRVTAYFNEESDPKFRQYDGRWLFLNVSFSPELRDFDQAAAERIFGVVAPVLRPGEPLPVLESNPPYALSRRNAADFSG